MSKDEAFAFIDELHARLSKDNEGGKDGESLNKEIAEMIQSGTLLNHTQALMENGSDIARRELEAIIARLTQLNRQDPSNRVLGIYLRNAKTHLSLFDEV